MLYQGYRFIQCLNNINKEVQEEVLMKRKLIDKGEYTMPSPLKKIKRKIQNIKIRTNNLTDKTTMSRFNKLRSDIKRVDNSNLKQKLSTIAEEAETILKSVNIKEEDDESSDQGFLSSEQTFIAVDKIVETLDQFFKEYVEADGSKQIESIDLKNLVSSVKENLNDGDTHALLLFNQLLALARCRKDKRNSELSANIKELRATMLTIAILGSGSKRRLKYSKKFMSLVLVAYGANGTIRDVLCNIGIGNTDTKMTIMKNIRTTFDEIKVQVNSIIMLDNNQRQYRKKSISYNKSNTHSTYTHIIQLAIEFYGENGYSHAKKWWNEDDINIDVYRQTDDEKSVMNRRLALSLAEEKKKFVNEKKDDTFLEDIKKFSLFYGKEERKRKENFEKIQQSTPLAPTIDRNKDRNENHNKNRNKADNLLSSPTAGGYNSK
jgi:hypothetical protein